MSNQPAASGQPYAQSAPGVSSYNDVTRPPPESYRPSAASEANYSNIIPPNGNSLPYRPPPAPTTSTKADPPYSQPTQTSYPPPPGTYPPAYPIPPQSTGLTYSGGPPPSAPSYNGPPPSIPSYAPMADQVPRPSHTPLPMATIAKPSLKATLTATESTLREYMNMQRVRRLKSEPGMDERLRIQAATALGDLRSLRHEVGDLIKAAEKHRFRRFLVGGVIASFIPLVRILFRRPSRSSRDASTDMNGAANDTEYAFFKSKSLVARILRSMSRPGLATVTFFVFAVMYVFQNEVTLRIARTVGKRLKRLSSKVERGEEDVGEEDLRMLQGWRWRILMWS